jgi:hypothetical protein
MASGIAWNLIVVVPFTVKHETHVVLLSSLSALFYQNPQT